MMITIVKAMEDLFINTYGVLENSYEEYLASDSSLAKLWEQMQTQDEGTRKVLDLNDQSGVADYNRGNDILKILIIIQIIIFMTLHLVVMEKGEN